MSRESENAAAKFVQGRAGNSPRVRLGSVTGWQNGHVGSRILNDGKRIYSYGEHFLLAERDDERGGFWVSEGKYQTGEWKSGKPKFSPTTRGHLQDVTSAVSRVADATELVRDGWENMPRHVPAYPMRFYRDKLPQPIPQPIF